MKKSILLIFMVSLMSLVSGQNIEYLGTFEQYSCIDLKQVCTNCTYVNVSSVVSDSGGTSLQNSVMTQVGYEFNKTFCNTTILSPYTYWTVGDIDGADPPIAVGVTFAVTADGKPASAFPIQLILMFIGIAMVLIGKLKDDFSLVQFIGSVLVIVMGVITLYPGYGYINHTNLTGMAVGMGSIGFGLYYLIERNISRNKQIERFDAEDDGRFHG